MYQRFALFLILALTIPASALAVEWTVPLADHRSSLPDRFTVFAASKETGNVLVQIDSSLAIVDKTGAVIARYELSHAGAEADSIYVSYARARPEGFFVAVREGPGGWDSFVFLMFLSHDGKVKWRYKIASGFGLDFNSMPTNRDWWFDDEKLIGFDDNGRSNPINIARLGIYGVRWFAEGQNSALLYAADAVNQEDTLILCGLDGSLIWRKSLVALDIGRLNGVPKHIWRRITAHLPKPISRLW